MPITTPTSCILTSTGPLWLDHVGLPLDGAYTPPPLRWPLDSAASIPQIRTGYDGPSEIGEVWIPHPACHLASSRRHASSREGRAMTEALRRGECIEIYDWSDPDDIAGGTWITRGTPEQGALAIWGATLATSAAEEGLTEALRAELEHGLEAARELERIAAPEEIDRRRAAMEAAIRDRAIRTERLGEALQLASTPATLGDRTRIELARHRANAASDLAAAAWSSLQEAELAERDLPGLQRRIREIRDLLRLAEGAPTTERHPQAAALARIQQAEARLEGARMARIQACAELGQAERGERQDLIDHWRSHAALAWALETEAAGELERARGLL